MTIAGRNVREIQQDLRGIPCHILMKPGDLTYQMLVSNTVLIVNSSGADAAGTVILPSLAETVGKFYFISATGGDVSLHEKETGSKITTYGDLETDDDHIILFSDGQKWRIILNGINKIK